MARSLIPNSTQIPDVILDHWMAELSGAEFKVLLYVARRTYGFGKDSDTISLNQLAHGIRRRDGRVIDRGTGLSRSGVKAACVSLIAKQLLIRTANTVNDRREADESTYRLNLFAALPGESDEQSSETEVGQKLAYVGQKVTRGRPESNPEVGQKLAPQETDQETDQETAAARKSADAELVLDLVKHGVGRRVAEKLAREKPEVCRRCLGYLPYAKIRTTSGAWLANSIEQEFGPPEAFIRAEAERVRRSTLTASRSDAAGTAQNERETALRTRLIGTLERLSKTHPDAFSAFEEYRQVERDRTRRFADLLTEERRQQFLESLDGVEHRAMVFSQWLQSEGRSYRVRLDSAPTSSRTDRLSFATSRSRPQIQEVAETTDRARSGI